MAFRLVLVLEAIVTEVAMVLFLVLMMTERSQFELLADAVNEVLTEVPLEC